MDIKENNLILKNDIWQMYLNSESSDPEKDMISQVTLEKMDDASELLVKNYLLRNLTKENITLKNFINSFEKKIIDKALNITNGNQKYASKILGVKETSLCEKIKKYSLKKKKKRIILNLNSLRRDSDISENNIIF